MRVICIAKDTPQRDHPDLHKAANDIQVGSKYTVIDTIEWIDGKTYYELLEFPHEFGIWWRSEYFATLPDAEPESITEEETLLQTV